MEDIELCGIVTRVPRMALILDAIRRFAPLDALVLIQGETGTGKQLVAHALHSLSHRSLRPFVTIDCAALPESLIESELFGHERGAFTGAERAYPGRIETARDGTLFLDEINSLSLAIQAKLLRFIEEGEFCRPGQQRPIPINVRLILASNIPLEQMVASGRMRADFFHRINVLTIDLPPLRERLDDLPVLVCKFLAQDALAQRSGVTTVADDVMDSLKALPWLGNVRELFNVLRRAIVMGAQQGVIRNLDLSARAARESVIEPTTPARGPPLTFRAWMQAREREYLVNLLAQYSSAARQAAAAGLPQRTLYRKLQNLKCPPGEAD